MSLLARSASSSITLPDAAPQSEEIPKPSRSQTLKGQAGVMHPSLITYMDNISELLESAQSGLGSSQTRPFG